MDGDKIYDYEKSLDNVSKMEAVIYKGICLKSIWPETVLQTFIVVVR